MKIVVLAEKPSVGRDIARVLGCSKQGNGYLEGNQYIVTWALGHLVELAAPETYDVRYKTWVLEDLPMLPKTLRTVVMKKTGKQFQTVKTQLNRKDVNEVIIATDAGREGELVARWIIDKARINKPIKRLWISSVTDQAIKNGFKQLKQGKAYENLYQSAVARSEADWYVGLNATRALTTKFNAQLSSGRVQTPTLAIIAKREEAIKKFKPRSFYGIDAETKTGLHFTWRNEQNETRSFSKERIETLMKALQNKQAVVHKITKKTKKQFAPQLYDLTDLQRDANRLFGYSGKQTLSIMQRLYERHKLLTYPRTDSRVISSDIVPTLYERIKACGQGLYKAEATKLLQKKFNLPKSVVNDAQVSDHHAIIPTEEASFTKDLDQGESRIYDLVVKRFLAVLLQPHTFEELTVEIRVNEERFLTKENRTIELGWQQLYQDRKQNNNHKQQTLVRLAEGNILADLKLKMTAGETTPPERFTEGALLQAMENPEKYMESNDKALTETITRAGGLGTVATRADIIDKLFNTGYMEQKGKVIHLTAKGRQLLDLVPADLKSPELTANWEEKLQRIAEGKLTKAQFMIEIKQYTEQIVSEIKQEETKFKHDNLTGTKCPECGKLMLEVKNRHGKRLVCQDRSCGYKKNISRNTNARCPNCHKKLQLRGEGKGQTFYCSCGHREKLDAFEKRRKERQKEKVSRKDIKKYMKQDDGFTNNALAQALAKFKK